MAIINSIDLSALEGAKRLDSEYYKPEYLESISDLLDVPNVRLKRIAYITDGEHGSPIFDDTSGIYYYSAQHVKDGYIDQTDAKFISPIIDERNKRSKLEIDDILLSTVGTVGFAGLVTEDLLPANIDRHAGRIKIHAGEEYDPAFITAFLNSRYGRNQTIREATGNVQLNLFIDKIKEIIIPLVPERDDIGEMHREGMRLLTESKTLYGDAENLILGEFELRDFEPSYELTYSKSLTEAFFAHRIDAEYFQPLFEWIIDRIRSKDHYRVKDIKTVNKRGVQPVYHDDGDISVVTSKRLGNMSIDYENLERTTTEEWEKNPSAHIRKYDVLIYTTGANVGRTNCYLEDDDPMASNHTNIVRIDRLNPVYVAVFLNSVLGQMQVKRSVSGSAQVELYSSGISEFVIWEAPYGIQEKVESLVLEAHSCRKRSMELFNRAKSGVEQAIEQRARRAGAAGGAVTGAVLSQGGRPLGSGGAKAALKKPKK